MYHAPFVVPWMANSEYAAEASNCLHSLRVSAPQAYGRLCVCRPAGGHCVPCALRAALDGQQRGRC